LEAIIRGHAGDTNGYRILKAHRQKVGAVARALPGLGLSAQLVDQITLAQRGKQQRDGQDSFASLGLGPFAVLAQGIQHRGAVLHRVAAKKITQPAHAQRQIRQRQ